MRKKIGNDGFSLVELIVAVLILGIVSSAAIVSMRSVYESKVDSAAKVFGTVIKQARTLAMGKTNDNSSSSTVSDVFAVFYIKDGVCHGEVYETEHEHTSTGDNLTYTKLVSEDIYSGNAISFTLWNHGDSTKKYTVSADDKYLIIYFKKNTGGILKMCKADSATGTNSEIVLSGKIADSVQFKNNAETFDLILVPATGKCYYNN